MASVAERLAQARAELEAAGFRAADAAFDAEVLARHLLHWDRAALVVRGRDPEPHGFSEQLSLLIKRRAAREPVAQIVGQREFWGLDFEVTRDVLVPRPESELLVEEALTFAREGSCRTVADVGTGSGCLAVAIAHELPEVRLTAIDLSPAALAVARRNAARHHVADRITFLEGDLLAPLRSPVDLIVANPPYVPEVYAATLSADVVRYEPHEALFGGADGLRVIEVLLREAPPHLADNGRLIVEFGDGQGESATRLAQEAGWSVLRVRDDLQGIPRTMVLTGSRHG